MQFEEALKLMREGAKITHPIFEDDEYFEGCYIGLPSYYDDNGNLVEDTFEQQKQRGMSIVKMKGDRQHPDMGNMGGGIDSMCYPGTFIIKEEFMKPSCKHGNMPQLNLFLVMSVEWKIWEKK